MQRCSCGSEPSGRCSCRFDQVRNPWSGHAVIERMRSHDSRVAEEVVIGIEADLADWRSGAVSVLRQCCEDLRKISEGGPGNIHMIICDGVRREDRESDGRAVVLIVKSCLTR